MTNDDLLSLMDKLQLLNECALVKAAECDLAALNIYIKKQWKLLSDMVTVACNDDNADEMRKGLLQIHNKNMKIKTLLQYQKKKLERGLLQIGEMKALRAHFSKTIKPSAQLIKRKV